MQNCKSFFYLVDSGVVHLINKVALAGDLAVFADKVAADAVGTIGDTAFVLGDGPRGGWGRRVDDPVVLVDGVISDALAGDLHILFTEVETLLEVGVEGLEFEGDLVVRGKVGLCVLLGLGLLHDASVGVELAQVLGGGVEEHGGLAVLGEGGQTDDGLGGGVSLVGQVLVVLLLKVND